MTKRVYLGCHCQEHLAVIEYEPYERDDEEDLEEEEAMNGDDDDDQEEKDGSGSADWRQEQQRHAGDVGGSGVGEDTTEGHEKTSNVVTSRATSIDTSSKRSMEAPTSTTTPSSPLGAAPGAGAEQQKTTATATTSTTDSPHRHHQQEEKEDGNTTIASLFTPAPDDGAEDAEDVVAGVCDCTHCSKRRILWYGIKLRMPITTMTLLSKKEKEVIENKEEKQRKRQRQQQQRCPRQRWHPRRIRVIRGFEYEDDEDEDEVQRQQATMATTTTTTTPNDGNQRDGENLTNDKGLAAEDGGDQGGGLTRQQSQTPEQDNDRFSTVIAGIDDSWDAAHSKEARSAYSDAAAHDTQEAHSTGLAHDAHDARSARIYRFQPPSYPSRPAGGRGGVGGKHVWCGKCGTYLLGDAYDWRAIERRRQRRNAAVKERMASDAEDGAGNGKREDDEEEIMVNLRAIRNPDFELWDVPLTLFPGGSRPLAYHTLPISPTADAYLAARSRLPALSFPPTPPSDSKIHHTYSGRCHCQAVRFKVLLRNRGGLEEAEVNDCACSICRGNGVLWLYPHPQDVFFEPSIPHMPYTPFDSAVDGTVSNNNEMTPLSIMEDDGSRDLHALVASSSPNPLLVRYTFGPNHANAHYVCSKCGCQVYEYRHLDPGQDKKGMDGDFGLNAALLDCVNEYLGDVLGVTSPNSPVDTRYAKKGWKRLSGLMRTTEDRDTEPRYQVRL